MEDIDGLIHHGDNRVYIVVMEDIMFNKDNIMKLIEAIDLMGLLLNMKIRPLAIGDPSQGICNVVLYCVFTPTVLNYFMKLFCCYCRRHGDQHEEERLLSSAWLLSAGTRDSQSRHHGNGIIVTSSISNRQVSS